MTIKFLRRHWSWMFAAAILIAAGGATYWITCDRVTPLEKDCASVRDLGRQSNEVTKWINTGLDDGTLRDPGEIVRRESALSDSLRSAADSVKTPEMTKPLTEWADAVGLYAQLQGEANMMPADVYSPPQEWTDNLRKYYRMTDRAVDALDRQCPGVKQDVQAR